MKMNNLEEILLEVGILFVNVFVMALLWRNNLLLTFIYVVVFACGLVFWKDKVDIGLFVVATVFFQVGEIILAYSGAWVYSNPTYLGIPLWLPMSWGVSAVVVRRLGMTGGKILKKWGK
ncbi:hypothetical protein ACFL0V_07080 [Nanoarchaeota archaeon]